MKNRKKWSRLPEPRRVKMPLSMLRRGRGLTQAAVAKSLGLDPAAVSRRESRGADLMTISMLRDYARILGDDVEVVFVSKMGHRIVVDFEDGSDEKQ